MIDSTLIWDSCCRKTSVGNADIREQDKEQDSKLSLADEKYSEDELRGVGGETNSADYDQ